VFSFLHFHILYFPNLLYQFVSVVISEVMGIGIGKPILVRTELILLVSEIFYYWDSGKSKQQCTCGASF